MPSCSVCPRPRAGRANQGGYHAQRHRGVAFDAAHISVEIVDHKAMLTGSVRSFVERRDAERAARNAPGVTEVENQLTVDPYAFAAV